MQTMLQTIRSKVLPCFSIIMYVVKTHQLPQSGNFIYVSRARHTTNVKVSFCLQNKSHDWLLTKTAYMKNISWIRGTPNMFHRKEPSTSFLSLKNAGKKTTSNVSRVMWKVPSQIYGLSVLNMCSKHRLWTAVYLTIWLVYYGLSDHSKS